MPTDYELYYGFTRFAIELNELCPELKDVLPRTDARFRPDQRYNTGSSTPDLSSCRPPAQILHSRHLRRMSDQHGANGKIVQFTGTLKVLLHV